MPTCNSSSAPMDKKLLRNIVDKVGNLLTDKKKIRQLLRYQSSFPVFNPRALKEDPYCTVFKPIWFTVSNCGAWSPIQT